MGQSIIARRTSSGEQTLAARRSRCSRFSHHARAADYEESFNKARRPRGQGKVGLGYQDTGSLFLNEVPISFN